MLPLTGTFVSYSGIWSEFHKDFLETEIKRLKETALWQDGESAKGPYFVINLLGKLHRTVSVN